MRGINTPNGANISQAAAATIACAKIIFCLDVQGSLVAAASLSSVETVRPDADAVGAALTGVPLLMDADGAGGPLSAVV